MGKNVKPRRFDKSDPNYEEKRRKNNEAIRRTRAKAKAKQEETLHRLTTIKQENEELEMKISSLSSQLSMMRDILEAHNSSQEMTSTASVPDILQNHDNKQELYRLISEIDQLNNQ